MMSIALLREMMCCFPRTSSAPVILQAYPRGRDRPRGQNVSAGSLPTRPRRTRAAARGASGDWCSLRLTNEGPEAAMAELDRIIAAERRWP
jgi:hypothetical protein